MKTYRDLLKITNADGVRFLQTWIKGEQPKSVESFDSDNWIYVVFTDKMVVSLPTLESGCKACFFGDLNYYNKFKKSQAA